MREEVQEQSQDIIEINDTAMANREKDQREGIYDVLVQLELQAKELEKRLAPVMLPLRSKDAAEDQASGSPVYNRLTAIANRMNNILAGLDLPM